MAESQPPMSYTTEHVLKNQSEHLTTPITDCCTSSRSALYSKTPALSTDSHMVKGGQSRNVKTVSPTTYSPTAQNSPLQDHKETQEVAVEKDTAPDPAEEHKWSRSDSKLQLYHFYFILLPKGNFLPSANLHQPQKVQISTPLQTCDLFYSKIFTMFMQLVKCKFICARSLPWPCNILCFYFVCESEM